MDPITNKKQPQKLKNMKKTIVAAAIVLGSLTAFATTPVQIASNQYTLTQEEFTEIGTDKLPEAVLKATEKTHPGASITKAYINKENQYKLEITVKDQSATVYADADGNWITK